LEGELERVAAGGGEQAARRRRGGGMCTAVLPRLPRTAACSGVSPACRRWFGSLKPSRTRLPGFSDARRSKPHRPHCMGAKDRPVAAAAAVTLSLPMWGPL
jgi:hypothetical protein